MSACQGMCLMCGAFRPQTSETQYHVKIVQPGAQSLWLQPFTVHDPRRGGSQAALAR